VRLPIDEIGYRTMNVAAGPAAQEPVLASRHVLVVDDDLDARSLSSSKPEARMSQQLDRRANAWSQ
jgi:hypothetical protein